MSSNQTDRNARQQELVQRLEEIRKKRQQDANLTPRHQMEVPQNRRNVGAQKRKVVPQKSKEKQQPLEQPTDKRMSQLEEYRAHEAMMDQRKYGAKKKPSIVKPKKKQNKNSLVKQLSDSHKLADAIVLNEVLSKPIAFRKNNR